MTRRRIKTFNSPLLSRHSDIMNYSAFHWGWTAQCPVPVASYSLRWQVWEIGREKAGIISPNPALWSMDEAEQLFLKSLKWQHRQRRASPSHSRGLHYTHFSSVDKQGPDVYATETAGEISAALWNLREPPSTPGTPLWATQICCNSSNSLWLPHGEN